MSYCPNFYNKFRGNNATFQAQFVPPPPAPPPFFIPPNPSTEIIDQEFVKSFESKIPIQPQSPVTVKPLLISEVREQFSTMIVAINELKAKEKFLSDNISTLTEEDWSSHMKEIAEKKMQIDETMAYIKSPRLDILRKLLAKRAAKRLRMKRVRSEIKREKEDRRKELEERSRKIDENLQRIKDDIIKKQQEHEAKLEADMVLKEVRRKKHDAKKCITKLDALVRLRKARLNTAKGRGETVPDSETVTFHTTTDKLKALWTQKLASYDIEEAELKAKLTESSEQTDKDRNATARQVADNLDQWREVLFGGQVPQVDFHGDVTRFIVVRSHWDQYISKDGTALPVGWVPPSM